MSSKINLGGIISGHINTLHDASTKSVSKIDLSVFFGFPVAIAILLLISNFSLTDSITTLLINFAAIFTALLLSVLVMVYEQGEKLKYKNEHSMDIDKSESIIALKKELLEQLYYNICYSIVVSVLLIFSCLAETLTRSKEFYLPFKDSVFTIDLSCILLTPIIVFLTLNLLLTILMVVKRMHTLLTV